MTDRNKLIIAILGAVGLLGLGFLGGERWARPETVLESAAPASVQPDGSTVLERKETTKAPPLAPHAIPRGSREERRVQVVVQPPQGVEPVALPMEADRLAQSSDRQVPCDCPPVTVDLSLVRMPDKTRRVIASSPDGKILSGVDVPIDAPGESPARRPWAVGILYTADRKFGGFLDRDLGPLRLGVETYQTPTGWGASARAGIRF